jgi:hypothetical protein
VAQSVNTNDSAMTHSLALVSAVCRLAGPIAFVDDARANLSRRGILAAVHRHDTARLFDWLMSELSYQGIADRVAQQYIAVHGNITWAAVERDLATRPPCPKLYGYWTFHDCRRRRCDNVHCQLRSRCDLIGVL